MGRQTSAWWGVVAVCALLGCGPTEVGPASPPPPVDAADGPAPPPPAPPPPAAPPCTPTSCEAEGALCGSLADGCGGTLQCPGSCEAGEVCGAGGTPNVCGRPPLVVCADMQLSARLPVDVHGHFDGDALSATRGSCAKAATSQLLSWTAPRDGTFVFDTAGSVEDTVLLVRRDTCWGEELACDDDALPQAGASRVVLTLRSGETVVLVVGSKYFRSGPYSLHIREQAPEEGEACSDGADNDADGLVDCAAPACQGERACAFQACTQYELGSEVPLQVALSGAHLNQLAASCAAGPLPELGLHFTAPRAGDYLVRLTPVEEGGPEAVLVVREACGGGELACDASAGARALRLSLTAGQSVVLGVESRGAWQLALEEAPPGG